MAATIDKEKCMGCEACVGACPVSTITIESISARVLCLIFMIPPSTAGYALHATDMLQKLCILLTPIVKAASAAGAASYRLCHLQHIDFGQVYLRHICGAFPPDLSILRHQAADPDLIRSCQGEFREPIHPPEVGVP
jgi:ferredoxin